MANSLVRPLSRSHAASLDRGPGTPIPPLSLFAIGFAAAYAWHARQPWPLATRLEGLLSIVGVMLVASGAGIFMWGMETFARARTGILLQRAATRVVVEGPYRWTRNPMYVGCVACYVGGAILLNSVWPLIVLPLVIIALSSIVIAREERYMRRRFGLEYEAYCRRVPRWL